MKGKEVKSRFILFLFVLLIIVFSFLVSAVPRYCNSCANCTSELLLAAAGEVINLTTSIASASGNCIGFNGKDNVTFDCQNYTNYIQGDNLGIDYGIHLNSSQGSNDNTIRNCNITRFYAGVFLNNSLNNTLSNITSNFNNRSIDLYNSSNNRLLNITSVNNTGYGIYARAGSYNLTLNKISAFYNTLSGVFLEYSTLSNLFNVNSSFNLEQGVYLVGGNNTLLFNIIANNNSQRGVYLYSYLVNNLNNNLSNIISNNNPGGGIQAETYNTTFWNITSVNNGGSGIFLGGSNNTLTNINCSSNTFSGIQLSSSNYNNSFTNIITFFNQYGIYLNQPHSNTFKGITANNNSEVGIYLFGAGGMFNVINNATTNLNRLYGVFMDAPNNNFTNIVSNSNLMGIYMSYSINSTLINITANSNSYAIYMAGVSYNYLANLDLWNCSYKCIDMVGAENNTISGGKINLSVSDNLVNLRGDYNNFSNLQFFESSLNDIGITTLQTSSSCLDNAVPAVDSCFDLSGTNACGYFPSDCSWNTNGYCEFIDGITSCFDIISSGACSYLSDCSWNSFNSYCGFQAGLTDCSQIFDSTSCDSVSGCGWTTSCEGTISGGCSNILVDSDCEQGSDMNNCKWNNGYCKDYVGLGGAGIFSGSCTSISSSGDCNDGTNSLCAYDNGYCKQNYISGRGEGGFAGSCSGIGDTLTCNSETNDLCYWLDTYDYSLGNNFLNCSYNATKESVESGSQLIRKWYYRAYVNDTLGNSLNNFNVTSFNVSDSYNFNLTTDITGFTSLIDIVDYVTNGSSKSYSSPYTFYVDNISLSGSHTLNASLRNNYMDIFTLSLTNIPPTNPSPILSSADGSNGASSNLNCYSQITDSNADKLNVSVRWYKNNVLNMTVNSNNNYNSGTGFTSVLSSGNLTVGDSWKCSIRIYDGWVYSSWGDSSSLTIISPSSGQNQTTGETGGSGSGSAQETYLWRLITPLIAAIMEIRDSRLDIIRIIINVFENVYNASLNITEINFSSETHREGLPPGQSYKAFRVEAKALNDTNIANATIEFRVNRTWLEQRNGTVEDINLYRKKDNENTWSPLKTRFLNSDVKYHYFSSLSPGFSTFVVFFGKYECQPGLKRCYNSQSQLCLGNATWLITERCSFGCDESGECIKTAPQSVIMYTITIAVVSLGIIITSYLILVRIFGRKRKK